jgi:5-methyltetrahydrofolate--homocysteine methyltransferase
MIIIGEKINGSIPGVGKAIVERDAALIRDLAQRQSEAGAAFIDVCASVPGCVEIDSLEWAINEVQSVTDTPICIDSPSADTCAAAIPFCKRPGLVNSVSMEGGKADIIFPLIAGTKWECVCLLCDDGGIPKTAEKRLAVFNALLEKAAAYKIAPSRLHIDPLVEMLCATEEGGITMIIDTMKQIKAREPAVHLTGGASNISFNLPARKFINRAFIILSMSAGMDSAILDPLNAEMIGLIYAAEALLGHDDFCIEFINAFRAGRFEKKSTN